MARSPLSSICFGILSIVATIYAQADKQLADERVCLKKCGQMEPTNDDPTARIIGGHSSPDRSFPFVVRIEGVSSCGGTEMAERFTGFIIDELWILTAAQPLYKHKSDLSNCPAFDFWGPMSPTWLLRPVETLNIFAGINDVQNIPSGFASVNPMQIYVKTGFNPAELNVMLNDVALLKLGKKLDIGSKSVRKICLAKNFVETKGSLGNVAGWGLYDEGLTLSSRASTTQRETTVPYEDATYCDTIYGWLGYTTAKMLCAGTYKKGFAKGDSGSPIMSFKNGRWYATGVASSIQTMGFHKEEYPDVYARISAHCDWIKQVTGKDICSNYHQEPDYHCKEVLHNRQLRLWKEKCGAGVVNKTDDCWRKPVFSQNLDDDDDYNPF